MAWDITDITIGDEVTITVTIVKLLDDGRVSVDIPYYGFPHSIPAPKKAKAGQHIDLVGEVTRVDEDDRLVTVKGLPGLVTVDVAAITGWTPSPARNTSGKPLRDGAD
ncbi:hypothetical protein [Mesorhizobium sp. M1399]|uniref:hypothetical protein n=1 Tax=Mesorhizobium sp. M1399 TaxID=2957096 RepID=UPI00333AB6DE